LRINTFIIGVLKPLAFSSKKGIDERKVVNSAGGESSSHFFFIFFFFLSFLFLFFLFFSFFLKELREYDARAEAVTSLTWRLNPISFCPPFTAWAIYMVFASIAVCMLQSIFLGFPICLGDHLGEIGQSPLVRTADDFSFFDR
jgi:Na+/proline symporter